MEDAVMIRSLALTNSYDVLKGECCRVEGVSDVGGGAGPLSE